MHSKKVALICIPLALVGVGVAPLAFGASSTSTPWSIRIHAGGGALTTLDGREAEEGVTLGPFGVEVMKITGSGTADAGREPA